MNRSLILAQFQAELFQVNPLLDQARVKWDKSQENYLKIKKRIAAVTWERLVETKKLPPVLNIDLKKLAQNVIRRQANFDFLNDLVTFLREVIGLLQDDKSDFDKWAPLVQLWAELLMERRQTLNKILKPPKSNVIPAAWLSLNIKAAPALV